MKDVKKTRSEILKAFYKTKEGKANIEKRTGLPMSKEARVKISNTMKKKHPTAKACMIGKRKFKTLSAAGKAVGLTPRAVTHRIESKGFANYKYV